MVKYRKVVQGYTNKRIGARVGSTYTSIEVSDLGRGNPKCVEKQRYKVVWKSGKASSSTRIGPAKKVGCFKTKKSAWTKAKKLAR